jgi:NAD+ diphosphatase
MAEPAAVAAGWTVPAPPGRPVPPLSRAALDRVAHRRGDADWQAAAWQRARVLVVDDGKVLVHADRAELVILDAADAPEGERYFLGLLPPSDVDSDESAPYYAVAAELPDIEGTRPAGLRDVAAGLPEPDASLFVTALALANWHVRHQYSPVSGRLTAVGEAGWTRVTDDGNEIMWPRTDPAVIVLVHDGVPGEDGQCLLGHNASWTSPGWVRRYSCLAGFVEPGESAEATVAREVGEEVGVAVREIRYLASQPWPFPGSLMLGFTAMADPGEPMRLDPAEIADARWFRRGEIAKVMAGESAEFGLPFRASIASYLINEWLAGRALTTDRP